MLKAHVQKRLLECGVDEAGRGALVGPVFAAAVILPQNFTSKDIKDSKKLSSKQREKLKVLIENEAICTSIAYATVQEIDELNIEKASFLAMHRAIEGLSIAPELLLIDGSRFIKYKNIQHLCITKGDDKYLSIAAASILAKTYRDAYMLQLHDKCPQYNWKVNKGYPTKYHREQIYKCGKSPFHRETFKSNFSKFAI